MRETPTQIDTTAEEGIVVDKKVIFEPKSPKLPQSSIKLRHRETRFTTILNKNKKAIPKKLRKKDQLLMSDLNQSKLLQLHTLEVPLPNYTTIHRWGKHPSYNEMVKEFTMLPTEKIQEKIDFYYNPYNRKFLFEKAMEFSEDQEETEESDQNWKLISELILNKNAEIFRSSIATINLNKESPK